MSVAKKFHSYMTHKNESRSGWKQQRIANKDFRQSAVFFLFFLFFAIPMKQKSAVNDKTPSISNFDVIFYFVNSFIIESRRHQYATCMQTRMYINETCKNNWMTIIVIISNKRTEYEGGSALCNLRTRTGRATEEPSKCQGLLISLRYICPPCCSQLA